MQETNHWLFKMNCITIYTTTGKYCKLINCLAWWRWMSLTVPVVSFSNLLATVFFKKCNSLKKSWVWCNWCVLCRTIKLESILSLCEPRTLFKGFNQNPIQKPEFRLQSDIIVPPLYIPPLYWYLNSMCLCWTLSLNRWPFIKQYIKSVSCSWKTSPKCLCIWQILHVIHLICDKSMQKPWENHYREQKVSDFTALNSAPDCKRLLSAIGMFGAAWSRTQLLRTLV